MVDPYIFQDRWTSEHAAVFSRSLRGLEEIKLLSWSKAKNTYGIARENLVPIFR
jgi:hypothetical protein